MLRFPFVGQDVKLVPRSTVTFDSGKLSRYSQKKQVIKLQVNGKSDGNNEPGLGSGIKSHRMFSNSRHFAIKKQVR